MTDLWHVENLYNSGVPTELESQNFADGQGNSSCIMYVKFFNQSNDMTVVACKICHRIIISLVSNSQGKIWIWSGKVMEFHFLI